MNRYKATISRPGMIYSTIAKTNCLDWKGYFSIRNQTIHDSLDEEYLKGKECTVKEEFIHCVSRVIIYLISVENKYFIIDSEGLTNFRLADPLDESFFALD